MSEIYTTDPTGINPENKISGEQQILTHYVDDFGVLVIPDHHPYFVESLRVYVIEEDGTEVELLENLDWMATVPYLGGTRSLGKALYAGITFIGNNLPNNVYLDYQTLGTEYTGTDIREIHRKIAESIFNPRSVSWDQVTDKPECYPPIPHTQDFSTVFGQEKLIEAIQGLGQTIVDIYNKKLDIRNQIKGDPDNIGHINEQIFVGIVGGFDLAGDYNYLLAKGDFEASKVQVNNVSNTRIHFKFPFKVNSLGFSLTYHIKGFQIFGTLANKNIDCIATVQNHQLSANIIHSEVSSDQITGLFYKGSDGYVYLRLDFDDISELRLSMDCQQWGPDILNLREDPNTLKPMAIFDPIDQL